MGVDESGVGLGLVGGMGWGPRPWARSPLHSSNRVGCLSLLPAFLMAQEEELGSGPRTGVLGGRMGVGLADGVGGGAPCLNLLAGGPLVSLNSLGLVLSNLNWIPS